MTTMGTPPRAGRQSIHGASRTKAVLHSVAASRTPITLNDVTDVAALQTRQEKKYLLSPEQFVELSKELTDLRILEIENKRLFSYESVYFDSPDLALFRDHRQGRRKRYKVRTRTYLDSHQSVFEVKLKGGRGETVKQRFPYRFVDRNHISGPAQEFLEGSLHDQYGVRPPRLVVSLTTRYSRATFVDVLYGARLTCDIDLECSFTDGDPGYGPDRILVESKSSGFSRADKVLARMGIRPGNVSKYCIGIALTQPDVPVNKWNRMLRTHFGWQRQDAATRRTATMRPTLPPPGGA